MQDNVKPSPVKWGAAETRKIEGAEAETLHVLLSDYHIGEWDIKLEGVRAKVHVQTLWEGYHDQEWVEAMTYDDTAITPKQRQDVVDKVYQARFGYHEHHYGVSPHESPLENEGMTVLALTGTREGMLRLATMWADRLRKDVLEVGGDDSYYDYFPGEVDAFWQLCKVLELDALYTHTYDYMTSTRYKDDTEDTLRKWDS